MGILKKFYKKLFQVFLVTSFILSMSSLTFADSVGVKGSVTKKGTYRPPHVRTSPNKTKVDNWSTKGNANPYTGKKGTKNPYDK